MTEIHDATPAWAKLDWAHGEIDRLRNEVDRRDVLLRWIAANMPRTLELCPYKLGELREASNQESGPK